MSLNSAPGRLVDDLAKDGFAVLRGTFDAVGYRELGMSIGEVVGEERIAIRPGAHAYVAKPGPVPLHTDQPEVDVIAWHCERQDENEGSSLLFDMRPFIEQLPEALRRKLHEVHLQTPPLAGGPPTMRWPVLRRTPDGDAVFCSPWLRSSSPREDHIEALDDFRQRLSSSIRGGQFSVRLLAGDVLFVDNRRLLHGRAAIPLDSKRCLRRLWLRLPSAGLSLSRCRTVTDHSSQSVEATRAIPRYP